MYINSTLTDFAFTVIPSLYTQDHIYNYYLSLSKGGYVPSLQATPNLASLSL